MRADSVLTSSEPFQAMLRKVKDILQFVLNVTFVVFLVVLGSVNYAYCGQLVDQTRFIATGYHDTLLHISTPGRYSIQAHSDQGTALELIDQMAGPMYSSGTVGKQDGRLDVLLDKGTYKIRLYSDKNGQGELVLDVFPFQEVESVSHPEDFPQLQELHLESGPLGDLQQRSYWLYLEHRQVLRLEAIGRNLKDCRLWRDGDWLVDVSPAISAYETIPGQPMTYIEFYHDLNPGLYLVTFYGGKALDWANDSPESPFHFRMGIPEIGTNGQRIMTISPFGRDVFQAQRETDFFELSRKDKKNTVLSVGSLSTTGTRHSVREQAKITKESRDSWCSLTWRRMDGKKIITIQGTPGDQVALKHFVSRSHIQVPHTSSQHYWISSQFSAEASDAIDVTAILTRISKSRFLSRRLVLDTSQLIEIGDDKSFSRKINLLGEMTVFLKILNNGTYVIEEDPTTGANGKYRIEPLLLTKPKGYRAPEFIRPNTPIELTKGLHVLTVRPELKGILSFVLRREDEVWNRNQEHIPPENLRQRILWPSVNLSGNYDYSLKLNSRPEVVSGLIVRALPLDLRDPLPIMLFPGEHVPIHMSVQQTSKLLIGKDRETSFEISGYPEPITSGSLLSPGKYTLMLKNTGQQTTLFTVETAPVQAVPKLSRNELIRKTRQTIQLPILKEEAPLHQDFDRQEKQHFILLVERPGLFRLETSGRLATRITVRTRFITSLFGAEQNGIGRNALVQQYLRQGEYYITVQTLGRSKGRAGIHLHRTPLMEEDGLRTGIQKKIRLMPDEAVRYRVEIQEPGTYQLRTLGLNKTFSWRLEDEEGWPLVRPNQTGTIHRAFDAANYYYYSLPASVESRRVTVLKKIQEGTPELKGKGPHPLQFNREIHHVWREEPERSPDVFVLNVPDPVSTTISLAENMEVELLRNGNESVSVIQGGEPKTVNFQLPGRYEFRVRSIEENDRLPYTLLVHTRQLISGLVHRVGDLPASFTVRVGDDSLVDVFSFGTTDVKAGLWSENQLIAQNDDMKDDWNFRISKRLKAGTYLLKLEQVGSDSPEEIEVGMTKRQGKFSPPLEFPFTVETELGKDVFSIPFMTNDTEQLVHCSLSGPGSMKLALFKDDRLLAETDRELFIPLLPHTSYTFLLWRLDQSTGTVSLNVEPLPIQKFSVSSSGQIDLQAPENILAAFKLMNAEKVSYTIRGHAPLLLFSPRLEEALKNVGDTPVVTENNSGWLVWKRASQQDRLTMTPFSLSRKDAQVVTLRQSMLPFDMEQPLDVPMLFEIESVTSTLGAMMRSQKYHGTNALNWFGMWMEPSRTFVAIPGQGNYRGTIWSTGAEPPEQERVRVKQRSFPLKHQEDWGDFARHEGEIQPGASHKIRLIPGSQTLNLLLSEDLVAFVWQNGQTDDMAVATQGNLQRQLNVTGGELFLLNIGQQTAVYRIEKQESISERVRPLAADTGFEEMFPSPGTVVLKIHDADKPIYVTGDDINSRFLQQNGQVLKKQGSVVSYLGGSGLLEVSYKPGYVRIWQSEPEKKHQRFFGLLPDRAAKGLQESAVVLKNTAQHWTFLLEQPTYIIADANAPGITALISQGQVLTTSVGSGSIGRQLEYFLPSGEYELWTRPLEGLRQNGELRLHKILPYALDEQSISKNWLIQAGETHMFSFRVTNLAKVGVGVQTESDQLETKLFDPDFNLIAEGPFIIQKMKVGEYIFTVKTASQDSPPIQYRPVVFGHHGSQQGIPAEVMEQYQQLSTR